MWGASLSPELGIRSGAAARRGSAPVIDTHGSNHITRPQRSVTPTPVVPRHPPQIALSECCSEVEDGFPCQNALSVPQASAEYRRLSDTSVQPLSPTAGENSALRRHSDLSSLLSLTSQKQDVLRPRMCRACVALSPLKTHDGGYCHPCVVLPACGCLCDFKRQPPSGGPATTLAYRRVKGSSDCSDFSLLQKSLFNIISRKAAPTQPTLLHPPAAKGLGCGDADGKSRVLSGGSGGAEEPFRGCEDRSFAEQQEVSVGVVCHDRRPVRH